MTAHVDFNPFSILPKTLMLQVLHHTFENDSKGNFKNFMDYDAVNENFRDILGDEKNLIYILNEMPTEFNIHLVSSLRLTKLIDPPGRYRGGVALLFLKYLYRRIKPFPDDHFLVTQFEYYHDALIHVEEYFYEYPLIMYVNAYVAYYMAKRLFLVCGSDPTLRNQAAKLLSIAFSCTLRATELEHPLAPIFHNDMSLQMRRHNIKVNDLLPEGLPKEPKIGLSDLLRVLSLKQNLNLDHYSDEDQAMLVVTWQKLMLENINRAKELFQFAVDYDLLMDLTHYFYECYRVNHYHRHIFAYNPVFVYKNNKNLLSIFKYWSITALVTIHQGFRVSYPNPDSILFATLLKTDSEGLKELQPLVDYFLTMPQKGSRGWRVCFLDAYRDALDEGSLKAVSESQIRVMLHYFSLADRAGELHTIMDRDADIVGSVFHCTDDIVHEFVIAVILQLRRFTNFDPLGKLDHQEILISTMYRDQEALSNIEIKEGKDFARIATTIIQAYKKAISDKMINQPEIIVSEFLYNNQEELKTLTNDCHQKFIALGLLKVA